MDCPVCGRPDVEGACPRCGTDLLALGGVNGEPRLEILTTTRLPPSARRVERLVPGL